MHRRTSLNYYSYAILKNQVNIAQALIDRMEAKGKERSEITNPFVPSPDHSSQVTLLQLCAMKGFSAGVRFLTEVMRVQIDPTSQGLIDKLTERNSVNDDSSYAMSLYQIGSGEQTHKS